MKTREKCQATCKEAFPDLDTDKCKFFIYDRINERCDFLILRCQSQKMFEYKLLNSFSITLEDHVLPRVTD